MKRHLLLNKSQKVGVTVLSLIILVLLVLLNQNRRLAMPNPFVIDSTLVNQSVIDSLKPAKTVLSESKSQENLEPFNPNNLDVKGWMNLGFSEKQSQSLIKYKNSIHGFKVKTDVQKSFVVSDEKYADLEPYIVIDEVSTVQFIDEQNEEIEFELNEDLKQVDINTASEEELQKVKGIGEKLSERIIKYRNLLGGFHSVSQLTEVYGMSKENYNLIQPQVTVSAIKLQTINVNQASIQEFKKHPYISWEIAEAIINQRLKGELSSLEFLVDKSLLNSTELSKLKPYISY